PAYDFAVRPDRQTRHLGKIHWRAEREIRIGARIACHDFFSFELPVEYLCKAMERFGGLGDRRRIWLAALEHDRFDHVLENEHRAGRIPMRKIPKLPARHV